jgi:LuxR family transcriptional regulator
VIYGYSPSARAPDGFWSVPTLLTYNLPTDWDDQVRGIRWADPYFHACFSDTLAVNWRDVQRDPALSADERQFLRGVAPNNMTQGITIPLHLPKGGISFLTFLGLESDREFARILQRRRSLLFLMAYHFLMTMQLRFIARLGKTGSTTLAKRELECLHWSALGKSSADTGAILGISHETVRIYLKRAYKKLDANNRCSATAKAIAMGLLDLRA